jgi:hypothetical protein
MAVELMCRLRPGANFGSEFRRHNEVPSRGTTAYGPWLPRELPPFCGIFKLVLSLQFLSFSALAASLYRRRLADIRTVPQLHFGSSLLQAEYTRYPSLCTARASRVLPNTIVP